MAVQTDDSFQYSLDSSIEALARGAVGATLGSLLGLAIGFLPVLIPMIGLSVPWSHGADPVRMALWFVASLALGSAVGATWYLRRD